MIEIIPAIDIIDGKCVRLTQGDFNQKKQYNENPLEVAKAFEDAGIKRLHLVDLDGARQKKIINHKVLQAISTNTRLAIDFGGGIQSDEDIQLAFDSGASQVTGGSVAVKNPDLFKNWISRFGVGKIILGADAKNGMIAVAGWQETTEVSVFDLISQYQESSGIEYIICTDVAKDGLLQGPSFDLYTDILTKFPEVKLIASGGVTTKDDLFRLEEMGVYGAIVGKAFYEGNISLNDLAEFSK
ncbi:MAG: 1-(5-phosphoribosyl)-5-[(5-phosphoribosylamino)methylideneamino]imidazole-4-carboxamide isomerase [Cytophagaceae bacterium]